MSDKINNNSFNDYSEKISNTSYFELLEKYILLDKTSDLDNKHKEWSKFITD